MLLTLATRAFAGRVSCTAPTSGRTSRSGGRRTLLDLPEFAISQLGLRGLNLPASMLSGWSLEDLDRLRDRADKAGCPCLVLVEDKPLPLGSNRTRDRDDARERISRLAAGAHRLGCNALSIMCRADDSEASFERVAAEVKKSMTSVERLELNLLLSPTEGLTHDPDRLTELIKKVGGFRIGSLPTFGHAAATGDPVATLRKLAPYAGAIHATIVGFDEAGAHRDYDLVACVQAIRSVGFVNTLAIDYVGEGDPGEDVERARQLLEAAIEEEA